MVAKINDRACWSLNGDAASARLWGAPKPNDEELNVGRKSQFAIASGVGVGNRELLQGLFHEGTRYHFK